MQKSTLAAKPTIARIAIPCPLRRLFDYLVPDHFLGKLQPGCRVMAPWRNGHKVGIVIDITDSSDLPIAKLKQLTEVIDTQPVIDTEIMQLCQFASDYYQYSLGEVLHYALPKRLRQNKPLTELTVKDQLVAKACQNENAATAPPYQLTREQQIAVSAIEQAKNHFQCFLLQGVTGSGKTEVYLQVMQQILKQGKQALLLVPEISLTPQTIERVEQRFWQPMQALHSRMTEKQRFLGWQRSREGLADIVIGTRSALFTPFPNLGVIIIDEEHDLSFKQQDNFRYSARDLAIYRAKQLGIPLILGSATPSLESLHNASLGRYQRLWLSERAGNASPPTPHIIDLKQHQQQHGLTFTAIKAIRKTLAAKQQVLIFLNRRGYSPTIFCTNCCWLAKCSACEKPFTYHQQERKLRCHHCNAKQAVPAKCPQCNANKIVPLGSGTERIENYLREKFADMPLTRIDRDTTSKKGQLAGLLKLATTDGPHILVGTQMLAKGHHFPNLTLVVVVDADQALYSADIFAIERLGQLLTQVAGRSGRAEIPGQVLVQTRFPENKYLQQLLSSGYHDFAKTILAERREAGLPPFAHFALFRAEAKSIDLSLAFLENLREIHQQQLLPTRVLGPIPAAMQKRQGMYRAQLLLQSNNRRELQLVTRKLLQMIEVGRLGSKLRWSIDVDPKEMY